MEDGTILRVPEGPELKGIDAAVDGQVRLTESGSLRNRLYRRIDKAVNSGRLMSAIFRVEDGRLFLDFDTHKFPYEDFTGAVTLLKQELSRQLTERAKQLATTEAKSDATPNQSPVGHESPAGVDPAM